MCALIQRLGFVQVDSINIVERAHHMILFARRQSYRPAHLAPLLERDRTMFEHWTHDAAIIPTAFYPHWQVKFAQDAVRLPARWREGRRAGYMAQCETVLARIRDTGPVCSADVGQGEARGSGGWWDWHPSKTALEYLWRCGTLSVSRREGFRKIYDLTDNVIPRAARSDLPDPAQTMDWLCHAALDRLGFATSGEIAAFWAIVPPADAAAWATRAVTNGQLIEADVAAADGTCRRSYARPDVVAYAEQVSAPPSRMRVLSPFDPALRDRARAERLFGFHYRIEVFVPAARRRYGYYVFPLLEGDRLIGRIDMKADRAGNVLNVTALWPETGVRWSDARQTRLEAELTRVTRFAGLDRYVLRAGWKRDPLG